MRLKRTPRPEGLERGIIDPIQWRLITDSLRDELTLIVNAAGGNLRDTYELVVTEAALGIYQYRRDADGRVLLEGKHAAKADPIFVHWT